MRRLLITGAMMVLMIVPQATVWAEDAEFTPAQMKQIRKMFEEWSAQQRQQQPPPAAGAVARPPAPPAKRGLPCRPWGTPQKPNPIRHGLLGW